MGQRRFQQRNFQPERSAFQWLYQRFSLALHSLCRLLHLVAQSQKRLQLCRTPGLSNLPFGAFQSLYPVVFAASPLGFFHFPRLYPLLLRFSLPPIFP